ncbi:MAG: hypothetical protein QG610_243 [Euryarchaeota archaeon]|nr:hypothetical protein [Euryarchaeota archaeon]
MLFTFNSGIFARAINLPLRLSHSFTYLMFPVFYLLVPLSSDSSLFLIIGLIYSTGYLVYNL